MDSTRRNFIKNITLLGGLPYIDIDTLKAVAKHSNETFSPAAEYGNIILTPEDPSKWPEFRKELHEWRKAKRKELNFSGTSYQDTAFAWTSSNYTCCFLMMYDLNFYDHENGKYTVDKILDRGEKEFGTYDSVVLWHAYPRIGFDERNQFDFYRDMPGGLEGVKAVVEEFHKRGVYVFVDYNPWDTGTRRESKSDIDALVEIIEKINADGIFLDTMREAGTDFREKLDRIKPGIAFEGELAAELELLPTHHLSWAQWFGDRYVPSVIRNKWYERRHMQHQIARWTQDHSAELHQAWMNGSGMMIWENVFGQLLAWTERDKSILRTMLPVQRRFHQHFIGEGWTPLVNTEAKGVFASLWERNGVRLWTLINRYDKEISTNLLRITHSTDDSYFDLVTGKQAQIQKAGNNVILKGTIPPRSIGCFVAGKAKDLGKDFQDFLSRMQKIKEGYNSDAKLFQMSPVLKPVEATDPKGKTEGMVVVHPVVIDQTYEMVFRECGTYSSQSEISFEELFKTIVFQRMVNIKNIAIDITPATNSQYYGFLKSSGYQPKEKRNFLKHWVDGKPPHGKENHPVVYIDLNDARAFAGWAGKRLPKESEWQFAAQGYGYLKYPWGEDLKDDYYNKTNGTTPVNAFPMGKSPVGCLDMCGNTWEWTESEHADRHNRFCILKGGSYYEAKGSVWYTKGGVQSPRVSAKFLMMYPGMDRCSTIGFRCVKDLE